MKRIGLLLAIMVISASLAPMAMAQEACTPTPSITAVAKDNSFDSECYAAPADEAFTLTVNNQDTFSHNFSIYTKKGGETLFNGPYVKGQTKTAFDVPALKAGTNYFVCDIHPFMDGTFLVGDARSATPTSSPGTSSPSEGPDGRAKAGISVRLERVASGLTAPVFATGARDGSDRIFIVDQTGKIRILNKEGDLLERPFLDISPLLVKQRTVYDERGLLGLAFHPAYKENGRFFVWYSAPLQASAPTGWDHTSHLSEFRVSDNDPDVSDPASEKVIMSVDKPQANHNGGHIAFGPDGMLYIPVGDGGNANDVGLGHPAGGNAQNLKTILGNVLRIDVDVAVDVGVAKYGIPKDNPYADAGGGARPEIYASGFRNPYHISFDAEGDRALYAADAGQDRFEEVSRVEPGGNYGWNRKEGTHCFDPDSPAAAPASCSDRTPNGEQLIDPVIEYDHTEILGAAIIGGYVYRGKAIPELVGRYVFGDYSRDRVKADGTLFEAAPREGALWDLRELQVTIDDDPDQGPGFGRFVLTFGQDDRNELYVGMTGRGGPEGKSGELFRLVAVSSTRETPSSSSTPPWLWFALGAVALAALAGFGFSRSRPRPR